jgi:hypothetical protein
MRYAGLLVLSLLLLMLAVVSVFADIPFVSNYAFWFVIAGGPFDRTEVRSGSQCAKNEDDQTWMVQCGYRGTQGATARLARSRARQRS